VREAPLDIQVRVGQFPSLAGTPFGVFNFQDRRLSRGFLPASGPKSTRTPRGSLSTADAATGTLLNDFTRPLSSMRCESCYAARAISELPAACSDGPGLCLQDFQKGLPLFLTLTPWTLNSPATNVERISSLTERERESRLSVPNAGNLFASQSPRCSSHQTRQHQLKQSQPCQKPRPSRRRRRNRHGCGLVAAH